MHRHTARMEQTQSISRNHGLVYTKGYHTAWGTCPWRHHLPYWFRAGGSINQLWIFVWVAMLWYPFGWHIYANQEAITIWGCLLLLQACHCNHCVGTHWCMRCLHICECWATRFRGRFICISSLFAISEVNKWWVAVLFTKGHWRHSCQAITGSWWCLSFGLHFHEVLWVSKRAWEAKFNNSLICTRRVLNSTRFQRWVVLESLKTGAEVRPCCFQSNSALFSLNYFPVSLFVLKIHIHPLPLLHQAVNLVAHCLLHEQVNALMLLGDLHVESNNRIRFLLFCVITLPSSSSKMYAQMSISFLTTSLIPFTLGFLPPVATALSFLRTY